MGDDYRIQDLLALLDDPVSLMERAIALLRGEAVDGRALLPEIVAALPGSKAAADHGSGVGRMADEDQADPGLLPSTTEKPPLGFWP